MPNFISPLLLLPPPILDEDSDFLFSKPTYDEILNIIQNLPKRKAPGPDGLPYEFYKKLSKTIAPILVNLFTIVIETSTPLLDSGDTITMLLHKKGKREDLRNWRPLALSTTDSHIFS